MAGVVLYVCFEGPYVRYNGHLLWSRWFSQPRATIDFASPGLVWPAEPILAAEVGGKPVTVLLDTGYAGGVVLARSVCERLGLRVVKSAGHAADNSALPKGEWVRFMLSFSGLEPLHITGSVTEFGLPVAAYLLRGARPDIIAGNDFLHAFSVRIDCRRLQVRLYNDCRFFE